LKNKTYLSVKVAIENIERTHYFRRFLGNGICQWSYFNYPRTILTLIFMKLDFFIYLRQ